ncbi:hypothetical protein BpHYR1_039691 [Brachionus plicatilis]|uniref:Uncharacterized protein n=1 Tax=Brachionus plicatilis TaxID=10195 RepID=A0A3M7QCC3_BRAPC|nr:hypothetical protein BpHYR1_039691 [Brachionus plicatilis]
MKEKKKILKICIFWFSAFFYIEELGRVELLNLLWGDDFGSKLDPFLSLTFKSGKSIISSCICFVFLLAGIHLKPNKGNRKTDKYSDYNYNEYSRKNWA